MNGHQIILGDFLRVLKDESITNILDAGSGRTSLTTLTEYFPRATIDAIIYPGDVRKLSSIAGIIDFHKGINVIEKDICSEDIDKKYDLIVAHLLLGEAEKFGKSFDSLLNKLIMLKYKYLIIIDYLEDPKVQVNDILSCVAENNLAVVYRSCFTNEQPQVWEDFTGVHNFGYLMQSL